jgi:hypothetical protein
MNLNANKKKQEYLNMKITTLILLIATLCTASKGFSLSLPITASHCQLDPRVQENLTYLQNNQAEHMKKCMADDPNADYQYRLDWCKWKYTGDLEKANNLLENSNYLMQRGWEKTKITLQEGTPSFGGHTLDVSTEQTWGKYKSTDLHFGGVAYFRNFPEGASYVEVRSCGWNTEEYTSCDIRNGSVAKEVMEIYIKEVPAKSGRYYFNLNIRQGVAMLVCPVLN